MLYFKIFFTAVLELSRKFVRKGVLRKSFFYALGALLCVAFLFLLLMYDMVFHDMRENLGETKLHLLENTISLTENMMDTIIQDIDNLTGDPVIVNTVISPGLSQTERNFQSITVLKNFLETTRNVTSVALLTNYDSFIYTAYGEVTPLSRYEHSDLFFAAPDGEFPQSQIDIIVSEAGTFLRKNFIEGYQGTLGSILVQLDTRQLSQMIYGQNPDPDLIVVTTRGSLFLPQVPGSPVQLDSLPQGEFRQIQPNIVSLEQNGTTWLSAELKSGGLTFYYVYHEVALSLFGFSGHLNSPWMLIYILPILVGIALMIAWLYYKPIQTILNDSSIHDKITRQPYQNEWILLSKAIGTINDQNIYFKDLVAIAAPDIQRRLLADLIDGKPISDKETYLTLSGINSELVPDGVFTIFVISDALTGVIEGNKLTDCISKLSALRSNDYIVVPFSYQHSLIILVQFNELTLAENHEVLEELYRIFTLYIHQLPQISTGNSDIFYGLVNLPEAYYRAYANLVLPTNSTAVEELTPHHELIRRTIASIPEYDLESAGFIVKRLLERVFSSEFNEHEIVESAQLLIKEFNKLAAIFHSESIPWTAFYENFQASGGDLSSFKNNIADYTKDILSKIALIMEKRQNKYLVVAKSYIHKHYSDCNLSLNIVSDRLGINPSYLSKLFNSAYKIGFSQYLNQVRIESAKKMIMKDELLIRDISEKAGFLSVQNFMRVFKKHTGCTPGDYRLICRDKTVHETSK